MKWGVAGCAGRRRRRTEKLHITNKTGNDQQEEQGRGLGQEDCTKSGWEMGGHAKALFNEGGGREGESSAEESQEIQGGGGAEMSTGGRKRRQRGR
jgi:hypothetical protein